MLNQQFRAMFGDLYFSLSRSTWTDDPAHRVVQLRNKIVELVEGRIAEIIGVTTPEESYLVAPGDGRYTLTRVCGEKIIEGCYFEWGFPHSRDNQSPPLIIIPQMLEVRGNPYKLTKEESPQRSHLVLRVEN